MTSNYEVLSHLRARAISEGDRSAISERLLEAHRGRTTVYDDARTLIWDEWAVNGDRHDTGDDPFADHPATHNVVGIVDAHPALAIRADRNPT